MPGQMLPSSALHCPCRAGEARPWSAPPRPRFPEAGRALFKNFWAGSITSTSPRLPGLGAPFLQGRVPPTNQGESMHCPRCGGPLSFIIGSDNGDRCESLFCIVCGECLDPVIEANRKESKPPIPVREYGRKPRRGSARGPGRPRKQGPAGHSIGGEEIV